MPIAYDLNDAQLKTAITSRDHLIRFLNASGREFFVMRSEDLIRALPEPFGDVVEGGKVVQEGSVTFVQNLVSCYRDHRRTIESGRVEQIEDPLAPAALGKVTVPIMKDEFLEADELDALVEWALRERGKRVIEANKPKPTIRHR